MSMFSKIPLTYDASEQEGLYDPQIPEHAFVNIQGIEEDIDIPSKFIVHGPKGSGKTMIAVRSSRQAGWGDFVATENLVDFEFSLLNRAAQSQNISLVNTWKSVLILKLVTMLGRDHAFVESNPSFGVLLDDLEKHGVVQGHELRKLIETSSASGNTFSLPLMLGAVAGVSRDTGSKYVPLDLDALFPLIAERIASINGAGNRYRIFIDGLDSLIGKANSDVVTDLLKCLPPLNGLLFSHGIDAKVIVLIRSELLGSLPGPDRGKYINDHGLGLNWYDRVRAPMESNLFKVIDLRMKLCGYQRPLSYYWPLWFPSQVSSGKRKVDPMVAIVQRTRNLPRDLIALFRELQHLEVEPPFSSQNINDAFRNYSDWFLEEMSNALYGMMPNEMVEHVPAVLSAACRGAISVESSQFNIDDLATAMTKYGLSESIKPIELANRLYDASWIGNYWTAIIEGASKPQRRYQYKHWMLKSRLDPAASMVIHPGLWKSLNVV